MNQPLRIEPVNLETPPGVPRFDLADDEDGAIVATVYGVDEDEAHETAIILASAALMYGLLLAIYFETRTRATGLNYDQWLRDVGEIVRRVEERA